MCYQFKKTHDLHNLFQNLDDLFELLQVFCVHFHFVDEYYNLRFEIYHVFLVKNELFQDLSVLFQILPGML